MTLPEEDHLIEPRSSFISRGVTRGKVKGAVNGVVAIFINRGGRRGDIGYVIVSREESYGGHPLALTNEA